MKDGYKTGKRCTNFVYVHIKMGFIKKTAKKVKKVARTTAEVLHLKTDHHLRGCLDLMDSDKLLNYQGSSRRAIWSSATGAVIDSILALANPLFTAPAAINIYQTGVSIVNRHRVKRQVGVRKGRDKEFSKRLENEDHPGLDRTLGAGIKGAVIAASAGIVGFDNIADNFSQLLHEGTHNTVQLLATQHVGHAVNSSNIPSGHDVLSQHQFGSHPNGAEQAGASHQDGQHLRADHFKQYDPHLAHTDQEVHKFTAGAGDRINEKLGHISHIPIKDDWSWATLKSELHNPADKVAATLHVAAAGAASEVVTPLLIVDPGVDKGIEHYETTIRRKREELAGRYVDGLDHQSGLLDIEDRRSRIREQVGVADEMRKRLAKMQPVA
jgi:hypothetical protein